MRLITSVGQMLRAMMHAVREQRPDDALETARDAVEALLEAPAELADSLSGEGLVTFMSAGGTIDVLRARMLGEVLLERARAFDALSEADSADRERLRAEVLLDAAAVLAEGDEAERIEEMRASLKRA